jgi:predicted HTH transcriptional regulator
LARLVQHNQCSKSQTHGDIGGDYCKREIIHNLKIASHSCDIFQNNFNQLEQHMALIDELTQRITAELHRTLDQCIRQAVESYVVGDTDHKDRAAMVAHFSKNGRHGRSMRRSKRGKTTHEDRSRSIIDAVAKLGEATIEDVAKLTGLDKRGVGSSLHYLAAAGKLRQVRPGKYKALRSAKAA